MPSEPTVCFQINTGFRIFFFNSNERLDELPFKLGISVSFLGTWDFSSAPLAGSFSCSQSAFLLEVVSVNWEQPL